jgi:hypothetical protein
MDRSRHGQNFAHLYLRGADAWANSFYSAQFMEIPPGPSSTVGVLATLQAVTVCLLAAFRLFGNKLPLTGGLLALLPSFTYLVATLQNPGRRMAVTLAPRVLSFLLVVSAVLTVALAVVDSKEEYSQMPWLWLILLGGALALGVAAATSWWTHARMWGRLSLRHRQPDRYQEILPVYKEAQKQWRKQDRIREYLATHPYQQ